MLNEALQDELAALRAENEELKNQLELSPELRAGIEDLANKIAIDKLRSEVERLKQERERCETGCMRFSGGEVRHHKDCVHYPESLTQMYDTIAQRLTILTEALEKIAENKTDDREIYTMGCDCDEEAAKALAGDVQTGET